MPLRDEDEQTVQAQVDLVLEHVGYAQHLLAGALQAEQRLRQHHKILDVQGELIGLYWELHRIRSEL